MGDELTVEELEKQVEEYESQLKIVNAALEEDPEQDEFLSVKKNLLDVLKITKDLLELKTERPKYTDIQEIARRRGIYIGMQCEALYMQDGKWYKAIINNMSENGFGVTFTEYGNSEVVPPDNVRDRKKPDVVVLEAGESKKSKGADRASIVVDEKGQLVVPSSLKILPTDSETIRKSKKKRLKHLKSQYRLQKAEQERNKRKSSWKDFQTHGKTKRARKNASIFQSPDSVEGKVGVTGSGKRMTEFKTQKYEPKKLASTLPVGVTVKKPVTRRLDEDWY